MAIETCSTYRGDILEPCKTCKDRNKLKCGCKYLCLPTGYHYDNPEGGEIIFFDINLEIIED